MKMNEPTVILSVANRYSFQDLSHLRFSWNVTSDIAVEPIASGWFDVTDKTLIEGLSLSLKQVASKVERETKKRSFPVTYFLNIRGSLKESTSWAKKSHQLVSKQFRLEFDGLGAKEGLQSKQADSFPGSSSPLEVVETSSTIGVVHNTGNESQPIVMISKATGSIESYSNSDGKNVFASPTEVDSPGMFPNFTRAATDNDRGGSEVSLGFFLPDFLVNPVVYGYNIIHGSQTLSYFCQWKLHGLDAGRPPETVCNKIIALEFDDRVEIHAECTAVRHGTDHALFHQQIHYNVQKDGRILVSHNVTPCRILRPLPSLPRVGMTLALDPSLYNVKYFGRGPHENYPDRKTSAEKGIYSTTAKDNDYVYIFPSENGSKSDCDWVAFRDERGTGVCIVPVSNEVSFNASLYSQQEFHLAKHTCDLPIRENGKSPVFVNLDSRLMGIGGDTSWYPVVYDQYKVKANEECNYR